MILKEIKPGMVIHCKNISEYERLEDETIKNGYGQLPLHNQSEEFINKVVFYINYKNCTWGGLNKNYIEFSDLILPELTAEEAIKIFGEICKGSCQECPLYAVEPYEACENLCYENPEKIVEMLAQWKSNHEKKEPEIETVDICRIIEIQQDGRKRCVHEETIEKPITLEVEETLKRYCMEHEGEFIAVHEVVSRVKRYRP